MPSDRVEEAGAAVASERLPLGERVSSGRYCGIDIGLSSLRYLGQRFAVRAMLSTLVRVVGHF